MRSSAGAGDVLQGDSLHYWMHDTDAVFGLQKGCFSAGAVKVLARLRQAELPQFQSFGLHLGKELQSDLCSFCHRLDLT